MLLTWALRQKSLQGHNNIAALINSVLLDNKWRTFKFFVCLFLERILLSSIIWRPPLYEKKRVRLSFLPQPEAMCCCNLLLLAFWKLSCHSLPSPMPTAARPDIETKLKIVLDSTPNLYRLLCFQVSTFLRILLKFRIRSVEFKVLRFGWPLSTVAYAALSLYPSSPNSCTPVSSAQLLSQRAVYPHSLCSEFHKTNPGFV